MMKTFWTFVSLLTLIPAPFAADLQVVSPDNKVTVSVALKEKLEPYPAGERLYYSVRFNGKTVLLDSPFGLDFKNMPPIAKDLEIISSSERSIDESWQRIWGKDKNVLNRCTELTIRLREKNRRQRRIDLYIRVYDDGFALRYGIPAQEAVKDFALTSERTLFRFARNHTVWAANYGGFISHQEAPFERLKLNDIKSTDIIGCPLLVKVGEEAWAALTEADLTDWAGMYFSHDPFLPNTVVTTLSPRLDDPGVLVKSVAPRLSPWRVVMLGESPGDLIESDIIANLNDPCKIEDTSWIKAGKSAWDRWWSNGYAPDVDYPISVDQQSMKYFIDFAAEMGWQYQLVDWEWYGPPFDPTKPFGMAGNPAVSILRQIEKIDIPGLVKYADKKRVGILVWLDWYHAEEQAEDAFPLYEKWGVAGVKIDFMQRDDQAMVNSYHRLVKLAAKHHLLVDFHGAYKPTGWSRTWPNVITREGVLGNEYNKWSAKVTPEHTVTVPFTRGLLGEMDFTPGGFRHKTVAGFKIDEARPGPFVMGTRCHQLAMMVVYESALQVLCDSPASYRNSPAGLDFLKIVPTTWDETTVINGQVGDFITVARRSGTDWYIGAMSDEEARTLEIPLDFLANGRYLARIFQDGLDADEYPEHVQEKSLAVTSSSILTAKMAPAGGYVVYLAPER